MIMTRELEKLIKAKGYTFDEMAKLLGVPSNSFSIKLKQGIFGSEEIEKMRIILEIENPEEIFFNKSVT